MFDPLFSESRGDTFEWDVRVVAKGTDTPVTGLTDVVSIRCRLRKQVDGNVLYDADAVAVLEDSEGSIRITFNSTTTDDILPGIYWGDVRIVKSGPIVKTTGPFMVRIRGNISPHPA